MERNGTRRRSQYKKPLLSLYKITKMMSLNLLARKLNRLRDKNRPSKRVRFRLPPARMKMPRKKTLRKHLRAKQKAETIR